VVDFTDMSLSLSKLAVRTSWTTPARATVLASIPHDINSYRFYMPAEATTPLSGLLLVDEEWELQSVEFREYL
jgi:hypothetical protein